MLSEFLSMNLFSKITSVKYHTYTFLYKNNDCLFKQLSKNI